MKTAQKRLGQSNARLTMDIYAQALETADRDAADTMGDRFLPSGRSGSRDGRAMDGSRKEASSTRKSS